MILDIKLAPVISYRTSPVGTLSVPVVFSPEQAEEFCRGSLCCFPLILCVAPPRSFYAGSLAEVTWFFSEKEEQS